VLPGATAALAAGETSIVAERPAPQHERTAR